MVKSRTFLLLGAALTLTAAGLPAKAAEQPSCYKHDKVLSRFSAVYDEAPVAAGLTQDGKLVEVLSSGDGQSWTLIISKPDGETCVLMAGEGWRASPHKPVKGDLGT